MCVAKSLISMFVMICFFFQAEDGIRDFHVTGVQTCALPILERVGEGIRLIKNESTVNFDFDSADLTSTAQSNLDKLAKVFIDNPKTQISIYGYTDSVGREQYNLRLSRTRANAVKSYLVKKGIGTKRITTQGMGPADPVASNDTDAGRAKNRRVEFSIVANEDMIYDARKEAARY